MNSATPTRHRGRWLVLALIVVLAAATIGWWVHERAGVHVGDRFDHPTVFADQLADNRATVQTPFGPLDLTIGIGPEVGGYGHKITAPHGAALVEVSWSGDQFYTPPSVWPAATALQRRDPGTDLTLVSGGRRYPIATSVGFADDGGSVLFVVKGDGTDSYVEARFAGRTVRSVHGGPSPRTVKSSEEFPCRDDSDKRFSWVHCDFYVTRSIYVAGLGAAPAGKEWLIVHGATVTRSERDVSIYPKNLHEGARYVPSGRPSATLSVAGMAKPARVAGPDQVIGDAVRLAARAWLVPATKDARVRLDYQLPTTLDRRASEWKSAPATYRVDVSTVVTYPGV
ncbi:hypothetical protein [Flexivirga oryzae]|uniref:Uncharacterized protein n=1 Tax=Flexivirga oryzae TaxID=1794944 RepID=A0A839N9R1_9MICO|nr:hypothetical protein [Flexivirga oryzae]MBB2892625.1 hypothetical protein [Flexivirga oryzae]MBB2894518.1 hypothetical protein [Flexivirga oryzae]